MQNQKQRKLNHFVRCIIVFVLCVLMAPSAMITAHADVATDSLTVKVGYTGMELSEYVEVGSYSWRELANNMPLHKVAYSYFQSKSKTKYTAIVDSAQGFYISDLLSYANIYYGDIKNLKFYVEDHKGIRTSFDRGALFQTRYYYEDLAGNRTVVYDTRTETKEVTETIHHDAEYKTEPYTEIETIHHDAEYDEEGNLIAEEYDEQKEVEKTRQVLVKEAYDEVVTKTVTEEVPDKSKVIEYTFEKAKKHAQAVQPMLAIEDNWAQFNEEFEHIGHDFSSMNAGNRFRLLFGQTSPTESLTSRSDKYVSCVYVTLDGQPTIGEMGGLNGSYGSHTVSMTVSADNTDIRNALSKLMNINSTNTDVLVVTGIEVTPDSRYSNLATVTVSYDIVGEGEASITAGVGQNAVAKLTSESVVGEQAPDSKMGSTGGKQKSKDTVDKKVAKQSPESKKESANNGTVKQEKGQKAQKEQKKAAAQVAQRGTTFRISDEAAAQFDSALQAQTVTAATEDITEVTEEDNTEKEKEKQRKVLILTALGCLGVGFGGAAFEKISFDIRRGRKFSFPFRFKK